MKLPLTPDYPLQPIPGFNHWQIKLGIFLLLYCILVNQSFAQTKIWDKTIGGKSNEQLTYAQQTSDGGYILGGTSQSGINGDKTTASKGGQDYWIVKLKADGTKTWDKTFGGNKNDLLTSLQQTKDGGYILGGFSLSGKSGDKSEASRDNLKNIEFNRGDYWIIKLNADGTKVWDKTIGGDSRDEFSSLQQTSDGGYVLGGSSLSSNSGDKSESNKGLYDYWVVKLKADGTKVWDNTIGGNRFDKLNSVQQTSDGGYIVGGSSESNISGDKTENNKEVLHYYSADYWIVKLTSDGTKAWDKTLGGENNDELRSLQQTKDGYVLGGSSNSDSSGDKTEHRKGGTDGGGNITNDYWVVKIKANGNKVWDKTIGGNNNDVLTSLQQTSDGGYLLGGSSDSGSSGDKTEEFQKTDEFYDPNDFWVVKIAATGAKVWDKTLGGNAGDYLSSLQQTSDGNYILGGSSNSGKSGDKSQAKLGECTSTICTSDYWVVKLDNSGKNLNQNITFVPIIYKTYGDAPFTISATASSGLSVTFSIVSGPATVKGNIVTLTGAGKVTVKARQAGNDTYKSAEATQTFLVMEKSLVRKGWEKAFGGKYEDRLTAMIATFDGGYLVGGTSNSGKSGDKSNPGQPYTKDYWIIKTDQQGNKLWDKSYGGTHQDKLAAIVATPDGGYLLGGTSESGISGDKTEAVRGDADYWVVKIDADGNKQWDKTFGGAKEDIFTALIATPDGGYLLGGTSESGISGDKTEAIRGGLDYWVVKLDGTGKKLWDKTFGGIGVDNLAALAVGANGDYLLGGSSVSGYSGDKTQAKRALNDFWVVRINATGTKVWDRAYGGIKGTYTDPWCTTGCNVTTYGESVLSGLITTPDGGFLLGGTSTAEPGAEKSEDNLSDKYTNLRKYWVVKINDQGKKEWDKTYVGGLTESTLKFVDSTYTIYGGSANLRSLISAPDGGFLLAGDSDYGKGADKSEDVRVKDYEFVDYWAVKIDAQGVKKWDKTLGGFNYDFLAAAVTSSTGGYLLGGSSESGIGGDKSEALRDSTNINFEFWPTDYWVVEIKDETSLNNSAWDRRYGGSGYDVLTSFIKTADGGYLSAGYSPSGISGDKTQASRGKNDYWMVKSDKNGKKIWDKRYGGGGDDYLNRVIQTQDGGYLLAGSSLSGISGDKSQASRGDRDYWIVKISGTGVKQWDKRYGGSGYDELKKVIQLSTGDYILAGYSNSPVSGDKSQGNQGGYDYWLVKISNTGTKIWDKRYGGNLNDALTGIVQTSGGGFLLGGSSTSAGNGEKSEESRGGKDFWLISVNKNGAKLWDKTYGGAGEDEAYSLGRSGSSDYFISGSSDSPAGSDKTRGSQGLKDFWFLKINNKGVKIWDKRFGSNFDDEAKASIQTQDGGYLLAGISASSMGGNKSQNSQGGFDYWIVKTDKDGMYQWDKRFGGSSVDDLRAVIQTPDGGYLLAGKSLSGASGDRTQPSQGEYDYWVVKVAPETSPLLAAREATEVTLPTEISGLKQLQAYPNPFSEKVTVSFTLPQTQPASVKVYDNQGREITTLFQGEAKAKKTYQVKWQAQNKATGLYFLQLQTPTIQQQQKILLTK
ncbi:hypothetical protein AHMF7605_03795 [Adhaeribacter arboris]|uniref:Secretion system C-terminal sorting domain-containing protein n=1 Tax=Adhaeribacter arboris TaxID=2072846 RepID=A0A2T2YB27_9BACT|nr:T9SS type A sorting domain-containing protein [Adhaeribacter arboris]PSR52709.1 hypothetical protein AHMF7605_03795 [Adhaeribacter arboris]